jgi:hypothetical protein
MITENISNCIFRQQNWKEQIRIKNTSITLIVYLLTLQKSKNIYTGRYSVYNTNMTITKVYTCNI